MTLADLWETKDSFADNYSSLQLLYSPKIAFQPYVYIVTLQRRKSRGLATASYSKIHIATGGCSDLFQATPLDDRENEYKDALFRASNNIVAIIERVNIRKVRSLTALFALENSIGGGSPL